MAKKIFAGSEIVEMAIHIEENGRDFYAGLISASTNDNAKKIYKILSDEEAKHIKAFTNMLQSFHKYEPKEAYPEEYFSYMKSLASKHVFTEKNKGREIASKIKSDKEALQMGICFEKESITFYEGMKKIVNDEDNKSVDAVMGQERKHLKMLSEMQDKIGGSND